MVRVIHWHVYQGLKYVCEDPKCKEEHMAVKPHPSMIVRAVERDSIGIQTDAGTHIQIPAKFIVEMDALLSRMREHGHLSSELKVWIGPTKDGPTMWQCSLGGYTTQSLTPWGAVSMMGRIILGGTFQA